MKWGSEANEIGSHAQNIDSDSMRL